MSKAREFIDFWVENSVHAVEQYRAAGASQDVIELTCRCIEAAKGEGISIRGQIMRMRGLYVERALNARASTGHFSNDPIIKGDTHTCVKVGPGAAE